MFACGDIPVGERCAKVVMLLPVLPEGKRERERTILAGASLIP